MKKTLFYIAIIAIASVAFMGCQRDNNDPKPGVATVRFETVPFVNESIARTPSAKSIDPLDNLVFYDYDDDYNYYFFVLGHINSVPLAYRPAVFFNGVTPITIGYSSGNVTQISISNSVTNAFTHSVSNSQTSTWGNEVGVTAGIEVGKRIKAKFEASYTHSWGGSESTDVTTSRSFSNTYETSRLKANEIRDEITVTIGNNNEPAGMYRFSLFTTTDVYFVVVTDRARTQIIDANIVFTARPTQYWALDFEPERGGPFGRTASGELLQIPEIKIYQLPHIEECVHQWDAWIPTIAPTHITNGEETRICALCLRTETRPIYAKYTGVFDLAEGRFTSGMGNASFSNNVLTVSQDANIVITGVGNGQRIEIAGNATDVNIRLKNISVTGLGDNQSSMLLNSGANVTLTLEGTNILTAGSNRAGIQTTGATLTINGDGSLMATGGNGGAGIGGSRGGNGSNGVSTSDRGGNGSEGNGGGNGGIVTINSGTIIAIGNDGGAGIGGGRGGKGGNGSDATNCGGTGGSGGVGGIGGNGGTITISGGRVTAIGNGENANIGGGQGGNGGNGANAGFRCLWPFFGGQGGNGGRGGNGGNGGTITYIAGEINASNPATGGRGGSGGSRGYGRDGGPNGNAGSSGNIGATGTLN